MLSATIDKEIVSTFEQESFPGQIHVIDTPEALPDTIGYLSRQRVLGFDTETKPCFTKGCRTLVSLLQLSTPTDCFLIRLNKTDMTEEIKSLLENPEILKVGLSIHDDYISLRRRMEFQAEGFVELQRLCPAYGIKESGLRKIYAIIFGKAISKAQQLSNWEAPTLSPAQQRYAALDAWACLKIYEYLMSLPVPSPTQFALL
ncbi:3'-5' exonuclease domain protein [Porphyromonas crevioricanis JCM 15906]|uniref:3'-5' exonuclease n=2 Tax=Porphyromonas crevioricanis TaxID=393921 RepID=A0A2X4PJP3_9PORP|nr:3'-5' exonuclease [Porphyromonas crevioricanis]KGN94323.1 3'-5' exonuclease [Porphyromonas crevioricanis]SJZ98274.1 3'-5' exonuclease [Porphyromonas crevioricanis]SQH72920.1 Ribonuclease D [Porphyromonas crevioricanis]GAD04790.1 3'-5' exonuclease domain protein [Porphyromonas crevioricanis JCM 15906]GAD07384.1 3'-5' exonuclease domain protein [Porphyromonas crevioricanis JCM 13913]